jgi:hypothetical protein
MAEQQNILPPLPPEKTEHPPQRPPQPQHHVKLVNKGQAARVFYDEGRTHRVAPGETVEVDLTEDAIERLKAEKHTNPDEPPPLEVTQLGAAEGNGGAGHKRRPAPTG